MSRRKDYGILLERFGKARPTATVVRKDIRLPSLSALLAIESGEQAVPATRPPVQAFLPFDMAAEPSNGDDAGEGT